jgi:phosphomannomutase
MEKLDGFHLGRELKNYNSKVVLDCANGVGSRTMKEILKRVDFTKYLQFELINDDATPEFLNAECGAEYVQKD